MAVLAVALGVALAFAVQLINASALAEFGAAVRSVNGQPDFELRPAAAGGFDEQVYARVAAHPRIAIASPLVEVDTYALGSGGERVPVRVLGLDALVAPALSPALLPRAQEGGSALDPQAVFLNPAARRALGEAGTLRLQQGSAWQALAVRGSVAAEGPPLLVMDIAGAQASFARLGRLSRIAVRLQDGADRAAVLRELALPADVRVASPDEAQLRVSNLSRSYRVNLTVLALVALFTGSFLVFSVQSLAVAKRLPHLALLGVLGLSARERLGLVLAESALLGALGAALGLALGTALAAFALQRLGGDLGSGMLGGSAPALQWDTGAALAYALLGVLAALAGGWVPARVAQRMAPAQSLKGLGTDAQGRGHGRFAPVLLAPALLAGAGVLALLPPVQGVPLAAYLSVALLLLGGIAGVPTLVSALLALVPAPQRPELLLAVQRARDQRHTAVVAVAGVVAALSLAVALTVMVASFRSSVTQWLDQVLPADLYVRSAETSAASDTAFLAPEWLAAVARSPGVARVMPQRVVPLTLDPARPAVTLLARGIGNPEQGLPLVGPLRDAAPGITAVYASETFSALYGVQAGDRLTLPLPGGGQAQVQVRALWRDYARQQGSLAIERADWQRLTGDQRVNDLAVWLQPGAEVAAVQAALQAHVRELGGDPAALEFATPGEIRVQSLRIFDRSFAVTYWLQAVAMVIGLFGIAANFSAQVLARRKEFGTLQHLGFTRGQLRLLVAAEGAVWTGAGALLGTALGLAVSVVLVHVVNPQSFHWTMDWVVPWPRLAALALAVLAAGTLTAWVAARAAASRDMALAVKEDW
ncbi:MAG TPA: ABC transporter permease [Burkholderiaceae bacterium]|nr:ABC transporter permease [Burkholderiaceae bacterium]